VTVCSVLASYNALTDPNLASYFGQRRIRSHLRHAGLVNEYVDVLRVRHTYEPRRFRSTATTKFCPTLNIGLGRRVANTGNTCNMSSPSTLSAGKNERAHQKCPSCRVSIGSSAIDLERRRMSEKARKDEILFKMATVNSIRVTRQFALGLLNNESLRLLQLHGRGARTDYSCRAPHHRDGANEHEHNAIALSDPSALCVGCESQPSRRRRRRRRCRSHYHGSPNQRIQSVSVTIDSQSR
jgi:hypothetical protein